MSKYHERIAAIAGGRDWTTDEGIIEALRSGLKLENYGTEFQAWSGGVPVDEEEIRTAIINEVTSPPVAEEYKRTLRQMMDDNSLRGWGVYAEADARLGPGVWFKHGDFERRVALEFEVHVGAEAVAKRFKNTTKTDKKKEDRAQELKRKLKDTRDTDETFYLFHANQCGYLVRNTTMRFWRTGVGQRGTSVMTHVAGITLPELQEFVDSTGRETLAGVSTHVDPGLEKEGEGGVTAMHGDFAKAIIDFLNLEWEVDVDDIKRQHGESRTDSKFQSIEHWGADRETVLERLIDRRGKPNETAEITRQFNLGYESLKYGGA